jgi:DNA-directed RNA polymerase alpha subunit
LEEIVPLSVRTGNVFKKAGIYTVGDLFSKSKKELLSLKNFGIKSLSETIDELMKVLDIERLRNRTGLPLIQEIINGEIFLGEEAEEEKTTVVLPPKEITIEQEKEVSEDNILNKPIEEMAAEIGLSQGQIEKLKKLQIETVEHLTHMKREDLLTGNYKLSKKNVDKIEDFLISHNLRFKE